MKKRNKLITVLERLEWIIGKPWGIGETKFLLDYIYQTKKMVKEVLNANNKSKK